jgi:hypothetical protein
MVYPMLMRFLCFLYVIPQDFGGVLGLDWAKGSTLEPRVTLL